jgi:hypothetical protein
VQQATGRFYRVDSIPVANQCYVAEELGACRVWRCYDYSPSSTIETSPLSAGALQITGTRAALVLEEGEPGSYAWDNTLNAPLWGGGERLLATVSGSAEFPGFSLSLIAPDVVTLQAPLVPMDEWRLDSGAELAFAWSGAMASNVYVAISVAMENPDGGPPFLFPNLDCGFFGTDSVGVVPASVLAKAAKPAGIVGHQIEAFTIASRALRIDDARLDFQAVTFALSALATLE